MGGRSGKRVEASSGGSLHHLDSSFRWVPHCARRGNPRLEEQDLDLDLGADPDPDLDLEQQDTQ